MALIIGAGALLSPWPASAQHVIDDGDQEVVDGSGDGTSGDHASPWVVPGTGYLTVGEKAEGDLIIQNGGQVDSTSSRLGVEIGSQGRVTVTGANSQWSADSLSVARGRLDIVDQGSVHSLNATIGSRIYDTSHWGEARVLGAGSALLVDEANCVRGAGQQRRARQTA